MKIRLILLWLATLLLAMPATFARATSSEDTVEAIANAFIEQYLAFSPLDATQLGDHRRQSRA